MARFVTVPDNALNVDIITPTGVLNCTTSAGGGGGGVASVTGTGGAPLLTVNNADPANPIVTHQPSEYLGELARGDGAAGWERATNGVVAATTIGPRPADANAVVELTSTGGRVHLDSNTPVLDCLAPTGGADARFCANGNAALSRLSARSTGGTVVDGIRVGVTGDGGTAKLGFYDTAPSAQSNVAGTDPTAAVNSLLGILSGLGLVGTVPTVVEVPKTLGFWGCLGAPAVAAVRFPDFGNVRDSVHATDESSAMVMPQAGTIIAMYCRHANVLTTDSMVYTVQKNGVDTTITATIAANTAAANDTAHSFTFVAGDRIAVKMLQSGTQAGASLGASVGLAYKST